jgi:hypothetical protein
MVRWCPRWHPRDMNSTRPSHLALALEDRVFYVESSVPPGLTLDAYRRRRARPSTRWGLLKRLAGSGTASA